MPHHAIANNDNLAEAAQNVADLFSRKPPHVTASGHIRRIVSNAAAPGHRIQHILAGLA